MSVAIDQFCVHVPGLRGRHAFGEATRCVISQDAIPHFRVTALKIAGDKNQAVITHTHLIPGAKSAVLNILSPRGAFSKLAPCYIRIKHNSFGNSCSGQFLISSHVHKAWCIFSLGTAQVIWGP